MATKSRFETAEERVNFINQHVPKGLTFRQALELATALTEMLADLSKVAADDDPFKAMGIYHSIATAAGTLRNQERLMTTVHNYAAVNGLLADLGINTNDDYQK
jgi:hypothetical protein